jgi:CII-binding regulator of phage lambda lysogenization HflD
MKYTQSTLDKLESIPEQSGYVLRYERGTFQSGYCILEERKVVVLNKFLQIEGRINTLIDLIPQLDINTEQLTAEAKKVYLDIISKLETQETETNENGS